jgi:YrbI family 3-deoxy-D-manno-octulosonate 8-phosphate phosphatase
MNQDQLNERCRDIRLVVTDVDGILTDGGMYYGEDGNELKQFSVKDGAGTALMQASGLQLGAMTGEATSMVRRRIKKIGLDFLYAQVSNKLSCLEKHAEKHGCRMQEIAYVGDEINDYLLLGKVGVFFTVPDANTIISEKADWTLKTAGGKGVLREVAKIILKSQGEYEKALNLYLRKIQNIDKEPAFYNLNDNH